MLRAHCAEVGRDPAAITAFSTVRPYVVLRDTMDEVRAWWADVARAGKMGEVPEANPIHTVDALVARLLEYWRAGVRGFIFYTLAPYDHETLRRLARDVRPRLAEALSG